LKTLKTGVVMDCLVVSSDALDAAKKSPTNFYWSGFFYIHFIVNK